MRTTSAVRILSLVLVATCLCMASTASAVSVQVRGGTDSGDTGKGSNIGLDVFFYEGRSFDFFLGYDVLSLEEKHDLWTSSSTVVPATTDATTTALLLGLRYKMQTDGSWNPYLSLGAALLKTTFTHQQGLESYYEGPFDKSTSGMRLGLGMDVGVSDQWSFGLEGSLLTGVPYYEDYFFGGGRQLDRYGVVTQVNVGIRYHFD